MNSHRPYNCKDQEKQDQKTETSSMQNANDGNLMQNCQKLCGQIAEATTQQIQIVEKVCVNTYNADKLIRLTSNVTKVVRLNGTPQIAKKLEKFSMELGQVRRLLRLDRCISFIKDYPSLLLKKKKEPLDIFVLLFKIMLLFQDLTDSAAYLMQLGIFKQSNLQGLRQRVLNLYFFENLGWVLFYLCEYFKKTKKEEKSRHFWLIVRYILDCIVSHNDFTHKMFSLHPKVTSILGLLSAIINLKLIWK